MKKVLILAGIIVALFTTGSAQGKEFVSFGTATEGGLYYIWGGGWAKVMNKAIPEFEVTAESTGGSSANAPLIERGKLQAGIVLSQIAYDMVNDKKLKNLRTLFPAYPGYFYLYSLKKSGLKTIYDISGKEIGYVKPMHENMVRMMDALGIKPAKTHILTHAAVIEALQDGIVMATSVYGPEKWPGLTSLEATHDVQFLTMTDKDIDEMIKSLPAHKKGTVPKGAYKATAEAPYSTMVDWNLILASKDLPDDIAYRLVKATFENNEALVAVHPVSSTTKIENIMNTSIPFHPGVIKYLKEKNVSIPQNLIPTD